MDATLANGAARSAKARVKPSFEDLAFKRGVSGFDSEMVGAALDLRTVEIYLQLVIVGGVSDGAEAEIGLKPDAVAPEASSSLGGRLEAPLQAPISPAAQLELMFHP